MSEDLPRAQRPRRGLRPQGARSRLSRQEGLSLLYRQARRSVPAARNSTSERASATAPAAYCYSQREPELARGEVTEVRKDGPWRTALMLSWWKTTTETA